MVQKGREELGPGYNESVMPPSLADSSASNILSFALASSILSFAMEMSGGRSI